MPLNPNGNNVLQVAGQNNVSHNVAVALGNYQEIHVAAMTGGGSSALSLRLNYTDGSVVTPTFTIRDWFADFSPNADEYYVADVRDRRDPHTAELSCGR